jgi:hypothetical protein
MKKHRVHLGLPLGTDAPSAFALMHLRLSRVRQALHLRVVSLAV